MPFEGITREDEYAPVVLYLEERIARDPTQRDRQGPDVGPQYRSAIFSNDESQLAVARSYIAELDQAHVFRQSIATSIEPLKGFYPAERATTKTIWRIIRIVRTSSSTIFRNWRHSSGCFPQSYRAEPKLVAAQ